MKLFFYYQEGSTEPSNPLALKKPSYLSERVDFLDERYKTTGIRFLTTTTNDREGLR